MSVGTPYKRRPIHGPYDAIVIGSGMGGLTAAAAMAKHAGKRVLVLERHYTVGGFTHTFRRPGFEWDVGVHYIGEVNRPGSILRRLFDDLTDGRLAWADMGEVYDTIVIGDDAYEMHKGREAFRARMGEYFPSEKEALERYLTLTKKAARGTLPFFGEKALPPALDRLFGGLMRHGSLRRARRTTLEVLQGLTDDRRLIGVLTGQFGDYGLPPAQSSFLMHAMVVEHYMGGAAYPVGGSSRIAETMVPVIEAPGGTVVTRAAVAAILTEGSRAVGVRLADGEEVRAPVVVSDAGVATTFGRLVPAELAASLGLRTGVSGAPPSVAHVCLYLGLDGTADELGLTRSNLWVYPSDDHDGNVARFIADPASPLPVTYLSFPSAKDPDFGRRFPGKSTTEAITLAPYEWFTSWEDTRWHRRGATYEAFKDGLTARLIDQLTRMRPKVRGRITHAELSTPLTTRHFAGHPSGEIYGLSHTPARFEARWLKPRTPIQGLYLTGADVCTAGVGGALFAGLLSASAVVGRNMLAVAAGSRDRRAPDRPAVEAR